VDRWPGSTSGRSARTATGADEPRSRLPVVPVPARRSADTGTGSEPLPAGSVHQGAPRPSRGNDGHAAPTVNGPAILRTVSFRDRLISTLRAVAPVLEVADVVVVGSEVPNLLEPDAASTLVVSQDVDIGVPVARHGAVKEALGRVSELHASGDEPSVWVPDDPELLEVNFVGMDPEVCDAEETYVLEDRELPLMVFGPLSLVQRGATLDVEGLRVPVPRLAGLLVEKLLTERSGVKGDRDLLVALGLLVLATPADLEECTASYGRLEAHQRHAVRANLSTLSLMEPVGGMPDPRPHRAKMAALLRRLERSEEA